MTTGRFTWRAGADGISHAAMLADRAGPQKTACGEFAIPENRAWPETSRCEPCLVALGFLPDLDDTLPSSVRRTAIPLSGRAEADEGISNLEPIDGP